MEDTNKEIQMESTQKPETPDVSNVTVANESPAKKASIFCFKKRKKSCEKVTDKEEDCESETLSLKPINQGSNTGSSGAEGSNSLWTSGGAWLTFKRLVTSRRRSKSALKKQSQSEGSHVHLETQGEDPGGLRYPKERAGFKISCLRFSKNRKKSSHCEITEEVDNEEKANEKTSILNDKSNCEEPGVLGLQGPLSAEWSSSGALEEREGDADPVKNVAEGAVPSRENAFAVEMGSGPDCYTDCVVQSQIIHSEKVLETEEEKQIFQLHQGSLYGNPEEMENKRFGFEVEIGPPVSQVLAGTEVGVFKTEEAKEADSEPLEKEINTVAGESGAKEGTSVEVMLHCSPAALGDEISGVPVGADEEVKGKENKPAMAGAGIVIMITEAEESPDEEEPGQACEFFSLAQANKQKGKKKTSRSPDSGPGGHGHTKEEKPSSKVRSPLSGSDQEHWTSEQYEVLLIETAASLVKAAIQSSIEQLVNEMALEQNKQNSFL